MSTDTNIFVCIITVYGTIAMPEMDIIKETDVLVSFSLPRELYVLTVSRFSALAKLS